MGGGIDVRRGGARCQCGRIRGIVYGLPHTEEERQRVDGLFPMVQEPSLSNCDSFSLKVVRAMSARRGR
jgi:hypothetical protein